MDIVSFGRFAFMVDAAHIRGATNLKLTAGCETEDVTENNEKFVKFKASNAREFTMRAILDRRLNEDVEETLKEMTQAAENGETGYLLIAGRKLLECQMMLTAASMTACEIAPNGQMVNCNIDLTLKQCSRADGSGGTGSGSGKKSRRGGGGRGRASAKTGDVNRMIEVRNVIGAAAGNAATRAALAIAKAKQSGSDAKKQSAAMLAKANAGSKQNRLNSKLRTGGGYR